MATNITLQRLNESMDEGVIVAWLKKEGEYIKKGDSLVEVETSKAVTKMESLTEGTLLKILVDEGTEIPVGTVIALVGDKNESIPDTPTPPIESSEEKRESKMIAGDTEPANTEEKKDIKADMPTEARIFVSPLARKIATENKVDLLNIKGSSINGRIVKKDVLHFLAQQKNAEAICQQSNVGNVEFSARRKVIASRMTESLKTKPVFVLTTEVIADKIQEARQCFKESEGQKISVTAIITKAVCKALEKYPYVNVHVENDGVKVFSSKNIGIAVADEKGLTVPVIKNVQELSLTQITKKINSLSTQVRDGSIELKDLEGGTFTISNLGMYDVEFFSAVINPPEAGILAVGGINERYRMINGEAKFVPVIKISLSIDHRALDGDQGARFLAAVKKYLENTALML